MKKNSRKEKAALLSIVSNSFLIIVKFISGFLSGSISIISEAIHSCSDLLAAIIAFFSVKKSAEPPDTDHHYGHGKYEDLSGFIEGLLILLAAAYILYESVKKIITNDIYHLETSLGIVVMLVSVIVNILVSRHLFKVAKETDSIALLADAEHLRTDIWTSAGVLGGLVLINFSNIYILDPIIAILVALLIVSVGVKLCVKSMKNLLDNSLSDEDMDIICKVMKLYLKKDILCVKNLKTRKSGSEKFIELVLIIPKQINIEDSHDLCNAIENKINETIPRSQTIIHIEPCDSNCIICHFDAICSKK